jgi:hypothetical protein
MKIPFAAFRGEIPIVDPRLLPDQNAQSVRNAYLRHGTLKPEQAPVLAAGITSILSPSTLYRYPGGNNGQGFWFVWGGGKEVSVVKSPLAADDFNRVYWAGDGEPKMGSIVDITSGTGPYPSTSYRLGIPVPIASPITSLPIDRVDPNDYPLTAVQTSYVVTQISRFGEEGPPSLPSFAVTRWDMVDGAELGGDVELTLPAISTGNHDITSMRIYRSELAGVFQEVGTVSAGVTAFTDNVPSDQLGVSLPSLEWDMPDSRMVGLTAMTSGFMAGFFDNTLCFSESFRPHAWPVSYQQAFTDDIVGIVSVTGGLVVATAGRPILVSGGSPAGMSANPLDTDQPCLTRRSLVDMGEYALYASPNGLVAVGGGEARVMTDQIISKDQWQALQPETIHAYRYENRYLAFYAGGCFAFTPGEGFEFYDIDASAGYYDIAVDSLYLIQGDTIVEWGAGPNMELLWRSKVVEQVPGAALSCAKVIAYGYPVTLRVYVDGALEHTEVVADRELFRLPVFGNEARDWEFEISSTNEVTSLQLATSPTEIA